MYYNKPEKQTRFRRKIYYGAKLTTPDNARRTVSLENLFTISILSGILAE
jgi:hypothetical protein